MTKAFSEGEWQDFLDFAVDNHFFIQEQEPSNVGSEFSGQNNSAYICYELMSNNVKAHAQTRSLNNLSASFKVFNGL